MPPCAHLQRLVRATHSGTQVAGKPKRAAVAELVDAPDLGSGIARCGGSSPFSRTINKSNTRLQKLQHGLLDSFCFFLALIAQHMAVGWIVQIAVTKFHIPHHRANENERRAGDFCLAHLVLHFCQRGANV